MQETTPNPTFARLHVWALTVAFSATALIIGILSLPVHLLRHHGGRPGGFHEWGEGPGGMRPWPVPSGAPQPWTGPPAMIHHDGGLALAHVLIALVVFAILAGLAGAIIAATYNALLKRSM